MEIIAVYWSLVLLFLAAFILPPLGHFFKAKFEFRGALAFLVILASFLILLLDLPAILAGKILIYKMGAWTPPIGIVLTVDAFNYLIALIITGIASLVAMYSIKHVEIKTGLTKFYTLLILLVLGMLGVSLTGDIFNMYVFFEIMSVSAYALVAFRSKAKHALEGGFKFLIIGSVGSSFMLLAIAFLYGLTGTLNMADMAVKLQTLQGSIVPTLALALLLTGLAVKAAIVPMHAWKPDALTWTSSEVAGLIAGVVSGLGIYCIFRIAYTIFSTGFNFMVVLVVLSLLTMIVGGLMALVQTDLKRLLAYSGISQSGYIVLALALATISVSGATGGLFHILNHAIAASLLFLCAGAIIYRTGTQDMNKLGGLASKMPLTAFAFVIGALAIIGVPPTNGFVSKLLIYFSTLEAGHAELTIIALIMSLITFAYYSKAIYKIFFGVPVQLVKHKRELPISMLIPMLVLTAFIIILGVYPQLAFKLIEPAAEALTAQSAYIGVVLP